MVYGSAAVTPSGNEITEVGGNVNNNNVTMTTTTSEPVLLTASGLMSVHSDPSVLSKPKPPKHRRHNSMFSILSSGSLRSKSINREPPSMSKASATGNRPVAPSNRLKWDWKLADLWHSSRKHKAVDDSSKKMDPLNMDPLYAPSNGPGYGSENGSEKDVVGPTEVVVLIESKTASDEDDGFIAVDNPDGTGSLAYDPVVEAETRSLHYTSLGIFASNSDLEVSGSSNSSCRDVDKVPLARRWREIQGAHEWEGLLDPLDAHLRAEILRYGDLAQMAYDNFQDQNWSKYAGSAKFSKKNVFEKLYKGDMGYQVTRYLYATCENPLPGILQSSISSEKWDVESNWMGFVAVAVEEEEIRRLGRRDIVVSWRGTSRSMEWLVDAQIQLAPMTVAPTADAHSKPSALKPKVEKGFWSLYTCKRSTSQFNQKSASEQVMRELTRLLSLYKGETLSITLTGHSLGGALAILTAYEIAETGLNTQTQDPIPVTVFSFGSPRIGDAIFKRRFEDFNLKALRIVNIHDVVPKAIGGLHPPWSEAYKHVGVELQVNSRLSNYMKPTRDPIVAHNLECYLHHVDGYQGSNAKEFQLETGRDPALVNKYCDALKSEFCVPAYWWQSENKVLLLHDDRRRWVEPDRALEDVPSLENRDNFI